MSVNLRCCSSLLTMLNHFQLIVVLWMSNFKYVQSIHFMLGLSFSQLPPTSPSSAGFSDGSCLWYLFLPNTYCIYCLPVKTLNVIFRWENGETFRNVGLCYYYFPSLIVSATQFIVKSHRWPEVRIGGLISNLRGFFITPPIFGPSSPS